MGPCGHSADHDSCAKWRTREHASFRNASVVRRPAAVAVARASREHAPSFNTTDEALPDAYKALARRGGGPRIPSEAPARAERLARAASAVLGSEGGDGSSYTPERRELFPWHSYLFGGMSKPSVHARALATVDDDVLKEKVPDVIKRLIARVKVLAGV